MKAKVRMVLGSTEYNIDIEEQDDMQTLHKMSVLGNPPTYCHVCGNTDRKLFKLDSNKDKEGNTYVNVVCLAKGCFGKAKLGQYKAKGFFWHRFEKFQPKGQKTEQTRVYGTEEEEEDFNESGF